MATATEEFLAKIHEATAKQMLKWLKRPEGITSQEMAQIIKFLKDNDITSDPEANDSLAEAKKRVADIDMPDSHLHLVGE